MYDECRTLSLVVVMATDERLLPLAVLGVPERPKDEPDLPMAFVPRFPEATSYREMIERAVGWGRR